MKLSEQYVLLYCISRPLSLNAFVNKTDSRHSFLTILYFIPWRCSFHILLFFRSLLISILLLLMCGWCCHSIIVSERFAILKCFCRTFSEWENNYKDHKTDNIISKVSVQPNEIYCFPHSTSLSVCCLIGCILPIVLHTTIPMQTKHCTLSNASNCVKR